MSFSEFTRVLYLFQHLSLPTSSLCPHYDYSRQSQPSHCIAEELLLGFQNIKIYLIDCIKKRWGGKSLDWTLIIHTQMFSTYWQSGKDFFITSANKSKWAGCRQHSRLLVLFYLVTFLKWFASRYYKYFRNQYWVHLCLSLYFRSTAQKLG